MTARMIRTPLAYLILWLAFIGFSGEAFAGPSCVCRYAGKNYEVGQCVRMNNSAGVRCGCCGYVLNNTAWKFSASACGIVSRKSNPQPMAEAKPDNTIEREISAILALR